MAEVLWLTPDKPDNISTGRKRIIQGLENRGYTITHTMDRRECLKELSNGHDILLTTTSAGGIVGPVAKAAGMSYLVDYVDPISQMFKSSDYKTAKLAQTLQRIAFEVCDGICYVYDEETKTVLPHSENITQTSLGVDFERFNNPDPQIINHAENVLYGEGIEPGFAVYIGGLEPIYNLEEMLEAAELSSLELVVAGTGSQRDLVEEYDTPSSSIHYLGLLPHRLIPGILKKAGVGLSLVDDPHTVKVLEYGASGLPTVQAAGRAKATLYNKVHFTDLKPGNIASTMEDAVGSETSSLEKYAKNHDYQCVIDDYADMIERVA